MTHATKLASLFALGCVFAPAFAAAQTIVSLNDNFSDTDLTNQALPSSSAWYRGTAGSINWSAASGAFVHTATSTTSAATVGWTHFTPVTIQDNQSLTVSLTLSLSSIVNANNNRLDFGLFNSNGTQRTSNTNTAGHADLQNDTGYRLNFNPSATAPATPSGWYERTSNTSINPFANADNTLLTGSTGETTGNVLTMTTNTPVTVTLVLTRSGSALSIASTVGAWTQTATDASGQFTFDTFAFNTGSNNLGTNGTMTIDNVSIVTTIPEPSSAALMAGAAMLGLVGLRRRRR